MNSWFAILLPINCGRWSSRLPKAKTGLNNSLAWHICDITPLRRQHNPPQPIEAILLYELNHQQDFEIPRSFEY
jgi:hypothetical protein